MGITGGHYRLTTEQLNKVGQNRKMTDDDYIEDLYLDKVWSLITYFLEDNYPTIDYFSWREPLEMGEYYIFVYHDEYQRESIKYNGIDMVKDVADYLSKINISEIREKFFEWDLSEKSIYPEIWENNEETFRMLEGLLEELIEFYKRAAADNNFVIVMID